MTGAENRPPKPPADSPPESSGVESKFEDLDPGRQATLVEEFWYFLRENKKWWMIPILLVFALMGLVIVLGATGAAPFIYTLF